MDAVSFELMILTGPHRIKDKSKKIKIDKIAPCSSPFALRPLP
jgi:hypothetical protein